MVIVSFIGSSQEDIRRQASAFLAETLPRPVEPLAKQIEAMDLPGGESNIAYAFVAAILERIPAGRKARAILRDIAEATLRGETARFVTLRDTHAEGNGQRFAGYQQSITKAAASAATRLTGLLPGGSTEIILWDRDLEGWRMSEANARAVIDLLGND